MNSSSHTIASVNNTHLYIVHILILKFGDRWKQYFQSEKWPSRLLPSPEQLTQDSFFALDNKDKNLPVMMLWKCYEYQYWIQNHTSFHFRSISKQNLSTCGHSTVVSSSIRGADLLREVMNAAFLSVRSVFTFITSVSISVEDVRMRFIWSDSEPEHTVISWTCFSLRVREDWTLESLQVSWTDWIRGCRLLNNSVVPCPLTVSCVMFQLS